VLALWYTKGMDRVTFGDGVSYEKASVIAKRFKYTADYVGQLCRGRKVDARLVGRTWYVNPDSLEKYQFKKNRPNEKVLKNNIILSESRLNVEPVIGKNTSRSLRFASHQSVTSVSPLHYDVDENDLYPRVSRDKVLTPTVLPVTISDAKGIRVHNSGKITRFKASQLPEVSLQGKIIVQTVSTETEIETESAPLSEVGKLERAKQALATDRADQQVPHQSQKVARPVTLAKNVSLSPLHPSAEDQTSTRSPLRLMTTPHALLLASVTTFVLVGATLFVSAEYFVSPTDATTSFSFDTTQFTALVALISYTH